MLASNLNQSDKYMGHLILPLNSARISDMVGHCSGSSLVHVSTKG